jgi:hypothetical protein
MTMTIIYVTCTDVEVADDHLRVILDCGHSYEARPHWNSISIEDYYKIIAQMIGKVSIAQSRPAPLQRRLSEAVGRA